MPRPDPRIRRAVAAFTALWLAAACQPQDTRPGTWLSGTRASGPVHDWTFASDVEEIFIETRTLYGVRHSTTIWCATLGGELYIGSYDEDVKFWERNVRRNTKARVRIGDAIYDVDVTPIDDEALSRRLDERYGAKYDMVDVFGDDPPTWRYYRVVSRD